MVSHPAKLIIYTDLDGTLLDHQNYSFQPAQRSLSLLANAGFPLLLNTSKTFAEVIELRQQLHNDHPFVTENGSTLCIPEHYFPWLDQTIPDRLCVNGITYLLQHPGPDYSAIIKRLQQLRQQHNYQFRGFADMSVAEIAQCTELPEADVERARQRQGSEPILWLDSDASLAQFEQELNRQGLQLLQGGRFLHVMGQTDKGDAIDWLRPHFARKFAGHRLTTVALGDSQNDLGMLESADIGVVIPDASGEQLTPNGPRIKIAPAQGPEGWDAVMFPLIQRNINSLSEKEFRHG